MYFSLLSLLSSLFSLLYPVAARSDGFGSDWMVRWSWVVVMMILDRRLWSDGHGSWVRRSNGHGGGSAWAMEVSSSSSSSSSSFFFLSAVVCGRGFGLAWVVGHRSWVCVCVWWVLVHWSGFGSCGFWFGMIGLLMGFAGCFCGGWVVVGCDFGG